MTEPLQCRGVSRDGENPHAAIVYFDRELTQDELRTLHENLSQPASPGNTDPMTIAKYDDELRKASPSRDEIADAVSFALSGQIYWDQTGCIENEEFDDAVDAIADAILSLSPASPAPWRDMHDDGFEVGICGFTVRHRVTTYTSGNELRGPAVHFGDYVSDRDARQALADCGFTNGEFGWRRGPTDATISRVVEYGEPLPSALGSQPTEQPPQAVVQVDKSTGEICTPPIRSTDANGDELVTFTSANTLADIARWIAENQTDAEEVIRILTDMTTVRALAGEE